jgi:hypothetical protein
MSARRATPCHHEHSPCQCHLAVETLLGDKTVSDQIDLGQLLANRCAYMLVKSHKERTGILAMFKEIYDTRSLIVHTGKPILAEKERRQLHHLRYLCGQLIRKELELMNP